MATVHSKKNFFERKIRNFQTNQLLLTAYYNRLILNLSRRTQFATISLTDVRNLLLPPT
jgi:hypothetical protein